MHRLSERIGASSRPALSPYSIIDGGESMRQFFGLGVGIVVGTVIGAAAVTALHAQTKSGVYLVSEITVTNPQAFGKEYAPKVRPTITKAGGKIVALGGSGGAQAGKVTTLQGEAPSRLVIQHWDSFDAVKAWWDGADYKAARMIGDKYAKFRVYVVDDAHLSE
jgi:uncharacterized protein (DUF1330 family)